MSTTAIKILALLFMTIDHIGEFFPNTPIWFRYVGRLSAMLYFFASAWGFYYTHDKKLYMKRLYKCSLLMCIIDFLIPIFIQNENVYNSMKNNIFSSILVADIFIYLIEITKGNSKKRKKYLTLFCLYQLGTVILFEVANYTIFNREEFVVAENILKVPKLLETLPMYALCSIEATEGPLYITMVLPLIYFSMHDKKKLAKNYLIYNICFFGIIVMQIIPKGIAFLDYHLSNKFLVELVRYPFSILGFPTYPFQISDTLVQSMFEQNYQWMMVFALPIMLLYNGKKGKGLKKLFYIYYPLHIVILYTIGGLMA